MQSISIGITNRTDITTVQKETNASFNTVFISLIYAFIIIIMVLIYKKYL